MRSVPREARAGAPSAYGASPGVTVSTENLIGLVLAVGLTVFLLVALLFPERF